VRVFEAGEGVGGTWYWNRYPGRRCDVESMQYSYSFSEELQQEWRWSERFSGQPEILRYANHVADRFDLRRDIRFETRVVAVTWDEAAELWTVETDRGDRITARFCVMATGCLSAARLPDIPGLASFGGDTYHTGHWPHEGVDFTGRRVAVIGTGSSAIQAIPVIAEQAARVTVFQRTPNFSIPSRNKPMDEDYEGLWKSDYKARRLKARAMRNGILYDLNQKSAMEVAEEERRREYEARWAAGGTAFMAAYSDLATNAESNRTAAEFVRAQIRSIVRDPAVAEALLPRNHPIGTKRICVDSDYYETFNRDNVTLVDVRETPIEAITPTGVRTGDGAHHEADSIVLATGFDAMTGALLKAGIRGRSGLPLAEKWERPAHLPRADDGGLPEPVHDHRAGQPLRAQQHDGLHRAARGLDRGLRRPHAARGVRTIEGDAEAEDAWVEHANEVAHRTLYPQAASWYMGANIPASRAFSCPTSAASACTARSATRSRRRVRGLPLVDGAGVHGSGRRE
jgi:cyclohexanone monooxygenase